MNRFQDARLSLTTNTFWDLVTTTEWPPSPSSACSSHWFHSTGLEDTLQHKYRLLFTGYFTGMDIPVEKASADTLTSGYQGPSESAAERWCRERLLRPAAPCVPSRQADDPWNLLGKPLAGSWCWCPQRWSEGGWLFHAREECCGSHLVWRTGVIQVVTWLKK